MTIPVLTLALATVAGAQPRASKAPIDADVRYARAVTLFEQKNYESALAEFMALHEQDSRPIVRYSIGAVHADMGHPVEAVSWLKSCLDDRKQLTEEQLKVAEDKLKEQQQQIGTISVATRVPVPDASIEVDGLPAAKFPLSSPIAVARGRHVVTVSGARFKSVPQPVIVAGQQDITISVELIPTDPNLRISTKLSDVEAWIDRKSHGVLPLNDTLKLAVPLGLHEIEFKRPGYIDYNNTITLGQADDQIINVELKENAEWIAVHGGSLTLRFSETSPTMITVDGVSRGEYQGPLRLAPGLHRVLAHTDGFFDAQRDIEIVEGKSTEVFIRFEPMPAYLKRYQDDILRRRKVGIAATALGSVVVVTSGGTVTWALQKPTSAQARGSLEQLYTKDYQRAIAVGSVFIALGAGTLATGIVLIAGNADPHRYAQPSKQASAVPLVVPMVWPSQHGAMVGMVGNF